MPLIRASYASGSNKVFLAMGCLSLLFIPLALLYPRKGKQIFAGKTIKNQ